MSEKQLGNLSFLGLKYVLDVLATTHVNFNRYVTTVTTETRKV